MIMKLLLIKIGKAWHTLKRDGLVRGGRRVLGAGMAMFSHVKNGDILFITGGVGDSARYRTTHIAEALQMRGLKTSVTVQDNPFIQTYADKFSIFVFHRVLYTPSVAKLIARVKAKNKEIIFETDDLVYDPIFLQHMDYFKQMNKLERKLYENGVGGEILADPYVKICTASTTFLADKLREKGKQVFVVLNRVSEQDVMNAEVILSRKTELLVDTRNDGNTNKIVRVAYLSGTPSHNKDFATINGALLAILEKYPQMRLVLVGPLDTDNQLQKFSERIERMHFLPRIKYFEAVANVDINLAPLEIGNPFCEAKSELKWIEAGLVGVPTVAAGTGTFKEAITDGVDGYVASTTEEWEEKIGKLINDEKLRKQMGAKAREKILASYTTKTFEEDYVQYLLTKVKG
jgi:glycosyltransferase involved in cell wall biosynthesis